MRLLRMAKKEMTMAKYHVKDAIDMKFSKEQYALILLAAEVEFSRYRNVPMAHRVTSYVRDLEKGLQKISLFVLFDERDEKVPISKDEWMAILTALKIEFGRLRMLGLDVHRLHPDMQALADITWALGEVLNKN